MMASLEAIPGNQLGGSVHHFTSKLLIYNGQLGGHPWEPAWRFSTSLNIKYIVLEGPAGRPLLIQENLEPA
jgi:hypothetical protein